MCIFTISSSNLYNKAINLKLFGNIVDSPKVCLRLDFTADDEAFLATSESNLTSLSVKSIKISNVHQLVTSQ